MDNKTFINHFTRESKTTVKDAETFIELLSKTMESALADNNSIAIPGFGQFEAHKDNEKTTVDLSTGKRLLLPPTIEVKFTPATMLIKKISDTN